MALSGMTGFARAEGAQGAWSWAVEARSVNGRNLEIRFKGPQGFDALERGTREAGQARFQRGQVSLTLQARRAESATSAVNVNIAQLERYLAAVAPYVAAGQATTPSADGLLALRGVLETAEGDDLEEDRTVLEAAMAASVAVALDGLKQARLEEGAALLPVLSALVDRIEALTDADDSRPLPETPDRTGRRGGQRGAHPAGSRGHGREGRCAGRAGPVGRACDGGAPAVDRRGPGRAAAGLPDPGIHARG
jgi:uncharacterized protein (TIGR00255 family)